ncbi:MAG: DUF47 family protein [Planctomycetales bacterium]|nr:DUF47 family protein [Planctomycetales bacterium]
MNDKTPKRSALARVLNRFFPQVPDFYGLIDEQCDIAMEAVEWLEKYLQDGDAEAAVKVRECEHRGDTVKARNLDILNRSFSTPYDREDIYRAIVTIDQFINYAKSTVRELEALQVTPDRFMHEMAECLHGGVEALQRGYRRLAKEPLAAETDAQIARKSERQTEKVYRAALASLFDVEEFVETLESEGPKATRDALLAVVNMFKHREVYRHLSNAADRVAEAGNQLHDIVVKIT